MALYKVVIVGGWCGNRMVIVADYLSELFEKAGYPSRVSHQSVWENPSAPYGAKLVLQLLPAFTEAETGCPVINIKPLLVDLDHPGTISKIMEQIQSDHPNPARKPENQPLENIFSLKVA
jgi:hypothetical protein